MWQFRRIEAEAKIGRPHLRSGDSHLTKVEASAESSRHDSKDEDVQDERHQSTLFAGLRVSGEPFPQQVNPEEEPDPTRKNAT